LSGSVSNARVWRRGRFVDEYAGSELRPPERVILERYREALAGRVLELGSGGGRVTSHLVGIAAEVHGLDIAPAMVDHARRRLPQATFHLGDMTDLSEFEPGSFGAVLALYNVLDVLGDTERAAQLDRIRALIEPGGLLVLSTHNRGHAASIRGPHVRTGHPLKLAADLVRLPRRLRNSRRLRPHLRDEPGYAIVNDSAHEYSLLHYYIARDDQERQLADHGFELVDCLDLDGKPVGPGQQVPDTPELHYVARRT
jgi:SAM-dependent methyltransferase